MATNPLDKVYLSEQQLETLAGGGSITSGSDTYTGDENTIYLVPDDGAVVQTTGSSTVDVMSQDAVTRELGAKLDKVETVTDKPQAYVKNPDGTQSMIPVDTSQSAVGAIVQRVTGGNIAVPITPVWANTATSKSYVDTTIASSLPVIEDYVS